MATLDSFITERSTGLYSFKDKHNLIQAGAAVNRRLQFLVIDPAVVDNTSADKVFRQDYGDVYDFLRRVMFNPETGAIVWTFAAQLERVGYFVFKSHDGIRLQCGTHCVTIQTPPPYLSTNDFFRMSSSLRGAFA